MSRKRIRWTLRALRRLDEIGAYIEKDDPDAAARVVARIVTAVDALAEYPCQSAAWSYQEHARARARDIPYRITRDVDTLTVMHAHQQWPQVSLVTTNKTRRRDER